MHEKHILLIIEDNPLLTGMYKAGFEKRGFTVFFAHDGREGIKLVRDQKPCVVVLDLLMPGMNGLEVLRQLKADPETKDTKIFILTIVRDEEKCNEALKLGAEAYINKGDMVMSDIVKRVSGALEQNVPTPVK